MTKFRRRVLAGSMIRPAGVAALHRGRYKPGYYPMAPHRRIWSKPHAIPAKTVNFDGNMMIFGDIYGVHQES